MMRAILVLTALGIVAVVALLALGVIGAALAAFIKLTLFFVVAAGLLFTVRSKIERDRLTIS